MGAGRAGGGMLLEAIARRICLALADDLCRCIVSPNIRGVGLSKLAVLLGWGPLGDKGVIVPVDGVDRRVP